MVYGYNCELAENIIISTMDFHFNRHIILFHCNIHDYARISVISLGKCERIEWHCADIKWIAMNVNSVAKVFEDAILTL